MGRPLSEDDVRRMRRQYKSGVTTSEILDSIEGEIDPPEGDRWTRTLVRRVIEGDVYHVVERIDRRQEEEEPPPPARQEAEPPKQKPTVAKEGALATMPPERAKKAKERVSQPGKGKERDNGTFLPCGKRKDPDPCYLFKLSITTEHAQDPPAPPTPAPPDAKALKRRITELQKSLIKNQEKIVDALARKRDTKAFKAKRKELKKELLEKTAEIGRIESPPAPTPPTPKKREFTVVAHRPEGWDQAIAPAERQIKKLQSELRQKMDDWSETHKSHEEKKKELLKFFDKVEAAEAKYAQRQGEAERIARKLAKRKKAQDVLDRDDKQNLKAFKDRERKNAEIEAKVKERGASYVQSYRDGLTREIDALQQDVSQLDQHLNGLDDTQKKRLLLVQQLEAAEKAEAAATTTVQQRKEQKKQQLLLDKLQTELPQRKEEQIQKSLDKAKQKASEREQQRDDLRKSLKSLQNEEETLRKKLDRLQREIKSLVDQIDNLEKSIVDLRNILPSGAGEPIEITAGTDTPWYLHFGASVKTDDQSWKASGAVQEDPVTVTVKVDSDTALPGWKGKSFGPDAIRHCQDSGANGVDAGKEHPYLEIRHPGGDKEGFPIVEPQAAGASTFTALQKRQFDDIASVRFLQPWNQCLRVLRVIKEVFGGTPKTREFEVEAAACKRITDDKKQKDVTASLSKKLIVYPSDSYEIAIKANSFASIGYEHAQTWADASRPQAETGQLATESGGSPDERTVSDTYTFSGLWGMKMDSVTKSTVTGRGGNDKDLQVVSHTSRNFNETEQTITAQGTFLGEQYRGRAEISSKEDITGNRIEGGPKRVVETGKLEDGGAVVTRDDSSTPQVPLTRVPPFPPSFFPLCPVDISFKRNGMEDEFTQRVKQTAGIIVFLTRQVAATVGRLGNWVPSLGWKVTFTFDMLSGTLSLFRQYREHIDRRVYVYRKGEIDLKLVKITVGIFGGAWFELLFLEFKAGAEIVIDGYFGVKGAIETAHPDADVNRNVGFGPTGGIGATAEIKVIVGNADWCKAAAGLTSGLDIEGMMWVAHQDGPHLAVELKFRGVKLYVIAHLVLVGAWEFSHYFVKDRPVWKGKFLEEKDSPADISAMLDKQDEDMEEIEAEMIKDGKKKQAQTRLSVLVEDDD